MAENEERKPMIDDEDKYMVHVHVYNLETDVADGHQHVMLGVTSPARIEDGTHCHRLRGRTSYITEETCGHWHWYDLSTGPAIEMPNGQHIHYIAGMTSTDAGHCHEFMEVTGIGPCNDPKCYCDDDNGYDADFDNNVKPCTKKSKFKPRLEEKNK